ncbi:MAG TPA: porin [Gammaproteobacteria bacterium]
MKKNMIALAVAGALVAPVAMAEVTVSGGLQAELVQIGGDGLGADTGLYAADGFEVGKENGGNFGFLKFSASEDLGGGLKALAMYNMNTHVGDESNAVGTRDAYVGLSGSLGTVLAGTLSTPYKTSTVAYDPFLMTSFQARGSYGMSALHNGYVGNALAYANGFAGGMVKVVAALVLDEGADQGVPPDATKTNGKHAKSLSVNIAPMSGLDIAVAYIDVSEFSDASKLGVGAPAGAVGKDASATKVGAKFSNAAFSVAGQVEMLNEGLTASGDKGNVVYLTGSFNVNEANSISVSVGQSDANVISTPAEVAAGTDDGASYAALGFKHAFSKSTSMTVGYRASEDKRGDGNKETAIGAGLRVAF